jgi:hypothetical protein
MRRQFSELVEQFGAGLPAGLDKVRREYEALVSE